MVTQTEMNDAYLHLEMAKVDVRYNEANVELLKLMNSEYTQEEFEVALNKRSEIHKEWCKLAEKLSYYNKNN